MIGSAAVLYFWGQLWSRLKWASLWGEVVIELLADWAKIFIGLVVPLLAIAAVIEAYITPSLLFQVMGN
ncbi:MAG: hypothetical protein UZ14_CFX002001652 [Chloroflexi bacterium OLB14]|nr:MAG: hypothetical protein UZ14_CFX002001652 [Chloroflexi bacterium OLB14]